jgi:hypothetical protein
MEVIAQLEYSNSRNKVIGSEFGGTEKKLEKMQLLPRWDLKLGEACNHESVGDHPLTTGRKNKKNGTKIIHSL